MQLDEAITVFLDGYFSTHDRSKKTEVAYKSDLEPACCVCSQRVFSRYA